jgi:hypothetical protein
VFRQESGKIDKPAAQMFRDVTRRRTIRHGVTLD